MSQPKNKITVDSDSIYDSYRMQLRAVRKSGPIRAGARKQLARERVSQRYNVPISVVKSIVIEQDELRGITHEHDVNYLLEREFELKVAELMRTLDSSGACPRCRVVSTEDGNQVRVRVHPADSRFRNTPRGLLLKRELRPVLSCFMCYLEISEEVA